MQADLVLGDVSECGGSDGISLPKDINWLESMNRNIGCGQFATGVGGIWAIGYQSRLFFPKSHCNICPANCISARKVAATFWHWFV